MSQVQQVEHLPDEERGMPSVNEIGPSRASRGVIVIVLVLVLAAGGGIAYWKWQKSAAKANEAAVQKNLQLTSTIPVRVFGEAPPVPASSGSGAPPPIPGASPVTAATFPPTGSSGAALTPIVPAPAGVAAGAAPALPGNAGTAAGGPSGKPVHPLDKSAASLMASNHKSSAVGSDTGSKGSLQGEAGQQGDGGMAAMLSSTRTPARSAGMLGNRNFILAKGSFIDCALQTRLDSTVPGMTACVITRNIYSDNGKVLLIERGSTVAGEYKPGMKQGMARIYVLWSRIKTPNGVVINLDSPGTDPLGGAGVPGYIDTHFWERFGGALMLSMVDDLARGLTSGSGSGGGSGSGSNSQFNFNSTGEATQNMATEALKNSINIPPTLYKNQGEQVGIYIARDLDFSRVYDVAAQ